MVGRVISVKLKGTATVLVEKVAKHPLYRKTYIRSKKYLVGADKEVKEGDIVEFVNCKPISKNKHWKIVKVIGSSLTEIAEEKLKKLSEKIISEVMPEEQEGNRVQGIGSSEEKIEEKKDKKADKKRKEKLVPKP